MGCCGCACASTASPFGGSTTIGGGCQQSPRCLGARKNRLFQKIDAKDKIQQTRLWGRSGSRLCSLVAHIRGRDHQSENYKRVRERSLFKGSLDMKRNISSRKDRPILQRNKRGHHSSVKRSRETKKTIVHIRAHEPVAGR